MQAAALGLAEESYQALSAGSLAQPATIARTRRIVTSSAAAQPLDVGLVDDGRGHDLRMRVRHAQRHRPADAAQRLQGPASASGLGRLLDVPGADRAVRRRGRDHGEIDPEAARERPHRGRRLDPGGARAALGDGRLLGALLGTRISPTTVAGVGPGPVGEGDQRGADLDDVARGPEQLGETLPA